MSSARRWVLGCALGCFVSGAIVGAALPAIVTALRGGPAAVDADEKYVQYLVDEFGLSALQQKQVRVIMAKAEEDEKLVIQRRFDQLPEYVRKEIRAARKLQKQRLRSVLDEEQRARYDSMDVMARANDSVR